jgi:hypothetical protein
MKFLLIAAKAALMSAAGEPRLGDYRVVPPTDAAARKALTQAMELIHKDAALGGLDLANPEAIQVERQIVAGQKLRTTAHVGGKAARRVLRAVVWLPLHAKPELMEVEMGPIGSTSLPAGAGPINGLPGGYSAQATDSEDTRKAADLACIILGEAPWLGRGVMLNKVLSASTQVVAGFNHHLHLRAAVKGGERDVDLVMYEPPTGPSVLTWVRIAK